MDLGVEKDECRVDFRPVEKGLERCVGLCEFEEVLKWSSGRISDHCHGDVGSNHVLLGVDRMTEWVGTLCYGAFTCPDE